MNKHSERAKNASEADLSINQSRAAKNFCNVSAVFVMATCGFCYGFFNRF